MCVRELFFFSFFHCCPSLALRLPLWRRPMPKNGCAMRFFGCGCLALFLFLCMWHVAYAPAPRRRPQQVRGHRQTCRPPRKRHGQNCKKARENLSCFFTRSENSTNSFVETFSTSCGKLCGKSVQVCLKSGFPGGFSTLSTGFSTLKWNKMESTTRIIHGRHADAKWQREGFASGQIEKTRGKR